MKLLQIAAWIFVISTTYGQTNLDQSVIPPSPNSSAMMRQANIPVNEYTGTARINIPIYSLPAKSMNIPISLDYQASGIRVQEIASSVGLGWNLTAGGRITRVVRHLPDSQEPRCGDPETGGELNRALAEACDSELDIYYYSILGRSGKFYIDPSGAAHSKLAYSAPANDMQILYYPSTKRFSIFDEQGYHYLFSPGERTHLYSSNEPGGTAHERTDDRGNNPGKYELKYTFFSSWVLTSIRPPYYDDNDNLIASFQYRTSNVSYENYSERIKFDDSGGEGKQYFRDTKFEIRQYYLSGIQTDLGAVTFNYQQGRRDLSGGLRLSSIVISDYDDVAFKEYKLNHSYYEKYKTYYFPPSDGNCDNDVDCNRLLLSGITEDGLNAYTFDYEDNETYIFPRRYSPHIDHWGFSNAKVYVYGSLHAPRHPGYTSAIPGFETPLGTTITGTAKVHDLEPTKALSLKQVNFGTGGYQRFVYGSHDLGIGGLRIDEIWVSDGSKEWRDVKYTYSGAYAPGTPSYYYSPYSNQWVGKSIMQKQQYDLDGRAIGYSSVTKTFADGSYVINKYSNEDRPDGDPVNSVASIKGVGFDGFHSADLDVNGPPFTSKTSYSWERGILTDSEWYNSAGSLVRSFQNTPGYTAPLIFDQDCFVADQGHEIGINSTVFKWVNLGRYKVVTKHLSIENSTVTRYDQSDPLKKTSVTTTYTYHPDHKTLPASKLEKLADGSELKTTYKYPFDFETTNATGTRVVSLRKMNGFFNHVLNVPIETVMYRKKSGGEFKVIAAHLQTFRSYEGTTDEGVPYGSVLPYEFFELRLEDAESEMNFTAVNVNVSTGTLEWDNKYKKVQEFEYDPITENLLKVQGESGILQEYEYDTLGLLKASITNSLETNIREDYTYENLNVNRVTDTNSKHTSYIHDSKNRLKLIKDQDENIVKRYRYNTKDQAEFNLRISVTGPRLAHVPQKFTVSDTPPIGETKYYWDFGDGNVIESMDREIDHTYTSTGTFTVTLVVVNPEFDSDVRTIRISIRPPLTVDRPTLSFPYTGGTRTVNVESLAGAYTVSENFEWVTITNITNSSFKVRCISNSGNVNGRTGAITVSNPRVTLTVTVIQDEDPLGDEGVFCPEGCVWNTTLQKCLPLAVGGFCAEE